ncbi:GNAT family N-acetyltransferase [Thermosulfurimonas marina]|uniref:GNAT family N-acetyltransferase n=1 Tax=Thermosulfurimonas marina TaxID=2047767 RepID=A0A6H1WSI2_9BACT|nr:GNAT family N-acetyltransferase [Thermosulfurimonas marina]QJA06142.1 GNAT family N-acetyltransferase [Thermosulfurimonas marina]
MALKDLEALFRPRRIALFDVRDEKRSPGAQILKNLILQGFKGGVYPISEEEEAVLGLEPYPDLASLPRRVDLAILAGEPHRWPGQIEACGRHGVRAVMIVGLDFFSKVESPKSFLRLLKERAREKNLRLLGPNSLGIIVPRQRFNASLFPGDLSSGSLAFVSDSATLAYAVLDWAEEKKIGFSAVVSLGEKADIDLADIIDYLSLDPHTRAIVAYIKDLKNGRKFMRAARAFAWTKPLVVVRGKAPQGESPESLLEALAADQKVYDAAFKRAGVVRVEDILDLFYLAESLSKQPRPRGPRLAIVTNAGGPAVLAAEELVRLGGVLANFSPKTREDLTTLLQRSPENPLDLWSSADPSLFRESLKCLLQDPQVDGLLVIFTPSLEAPVEEFAWAVVRAQKEFPYKPLLASFMGATRVLEGRQILTKENIPHFVSPVEAVKSFYYMFRYEHNLRLLSETPTAVAEDLQPDLEALRRLFTEIRKEGRFELRPEEIHRVLEAYGLCGKDPRAPDLPAPLFLATTRHPTFGAVILCGLGGLWLEMEKDYALGLPPLNQTLARRLLEETRIYGYLRQHHPQAAVFVEELLVRLSHLVVNLPEIREIFIPALEVSSGEIRPREARIVLEEGWLDLPRFSLGYYCPAHLAICPYPSHFTFEERLKDGRMVKIRPIKPEDEPLMAELFRTFSEETIRFRFLQTKKSLSHEELARYCQIDYDRELALVALLPHEKEPCWRIVGVVRLIKSPDEESAEMAVVVGDPWQGLGLGRILCEKMLAVARNLHLKRILMTILRENRRMLALAERLGFEVKEEEEDLILVEKNL